MTYTGSPGPVSSIDVKSKSSLDLATAERHDLEMLHLKAGSGVSVR